MADDPDTRISPSLDPETYRSIEGYERHAQFVGCVVNAMNDAYVTLGELHDARKLAESNRAWTPENRILIVGKEADKHKLRILKKFDLAQRDLAANIAQTEKLLSEPLEQKAGLGSLNVEVRAHAKALSRSDREAFLREALDRGDDATLTAVLGGQHFLSGMSKVDHDHFVWRYHSKRNPELVARLDTMQRFRDRLDRIGPIIHAQFAQAVGADPGTLHAIRDANERALNALNIEPKP